MHICQPAQDDTATGRGLTQSALFGLQLACLLAISSIARESPEPSPETQPHSAIDTLLTTPDNPTDSLSVDDTPLLDTLTTVKTTEDSVRYEADIIEYDIGNRIVFMHGNGIVRYHSMTLYADTIHYLVNRDLLVATGQPQLIDRSDTVAGEHMVYNLETRRGRVHYGTAHSAEDSYSGLSIARSDDNAFYIEEGAYTTCANHDSPHFCIYGRRIKVIPQDKAITRPVVLNIGGAPVAALPYYIMPLDHDRHSGFLNPRWGGNPTRGGRLSDIGYYWAPNDYVDLTAKGKVYEFQDYLVEAMSNYAVRYWLSGNLNGSYTLSNGPETLNNQWTVRYRHNQWLLPDHSMQLSGSGSIVSSKTFYRDWDDTTEYINQRTDAHLNLSKSFRKLNARTNATWNRVHDFSTDRVSHDLPSLSFSLSARSFIPVREVEDRDDSDEDEKEKWYNNLRYNYGASANRKFAYTKQTSGMGNVFDHSGFTHSSRIDAPLTVLKWFKFTPRLDLQHSIYDAYSDSTLGRRDSLRVTEYDTIYSADVASSYSDVEERTDENDSVYYIRPTKTERDTYYVFTSWRNDRFSWHNAQAFSWSTGADLTTNLYGVFPIRIFNFVGMRHTITPRIGYTYVPNARLNTDKQFPSVGISHSLQRAKRQLVTLSVGNLFHGKAVTRRSAQDKEEREHTFEILNADVSTSYDFVAETRKLGDIQLSVRRSSGKLFTVSYNSTYRPYNMRDRIDFPPNLMRYGVSISPGNISAGGKLWGGDFLLFEGLATDDYRPGFPKSGHPGWNISVSPSYEFSRSRSSLEEDFTTRREYSLRGNAGLGLTDIWSLRWSAYYNFQTGRLEGNRFNFDCDLECWALRFNWDLSRSNQGFDFVVHVKKIPDIKWEEDNRRRRD